MSLSSVTSPSRIVLSLSLPLARAAAAEDFFPVVARVDMDSSGTYWRSSCTLRRVATNNDAGAAASAGGPPYTCKRNWVSALLVDSPALRPGASPQPWLYSLSVESVCDAVCAICACTCDRLVSCGSNASSHSAACRIGVWGMREAVGYIENTHGRNLTHTGPSYTTPHQDTPLWTYEAHTLLVNTYLSASHREQVCKLK